eukprot:tig00020904_g15229.t1
MRCNITWDSSSSGSPQSRTSRSVIWFLAIRWHLGDRTASLPLARFARGFRLRRKNSDATRSRSPVRGEVRVVFAHAHDSKAS